MPSRGLRHRPPRHSRGGRAFQQRRSATASGGQVQRIVRIPDLLPHRSKFQAEEQRSANEAKNAVFVQAIEALQAAAPERFELPKPEDNVHSIPLDSVVPGAKLAMYRLEVKAGSLGAGEVRRFGLLSALPPSRYAFQLEVWDEGVRPDCHSDPAPGAEAQWLHTVRIEPAEPPGILDTEQHERVQAFHKEAVADGADDPTPTSLLAVCLGEDGRIDWQATRDRHPTPRWLRCLRVRVLRFQCMEFLASCAPVGPAPSPLKLEAVADRVSPAFEALQLHGRANLRMLAAVELHVQHPLDDARLLERRVEEFAGNARCAALLLASGFLGGASVRQPLTDTAEAAALTEALLGAYALELGGDRYSAIKCWEWLAKEDGMAMAGRYFAGTDRKYLGRTQTYESLTEKMVNGAPTRRPTPATGGRRCTRGPYSGRNP